MVADPQAQGKLRPSPFAGETRVALQNASLPAERQTCFERLRRAPNQKPKPANL
jgi:hypothetical protein